ncbi:M48 family metallopeptidase [Devosia aurantiaca]|uniref:M48 family metalloprotease n=1 Tax=Devosia aurantiaca TaxID=2714858 RepID=A0A6M1SNG0_9HYPH|nr:M48 family metallopeptidase [Devosia aurantiaca]NGP17032.1 M48 family metalloprotease [Devosia aurantiaca]
MLLNSKRFLVVTTLVVPLLIAALGFWQIQRGEEYRDFVFEQRAALKAQLVEMSALPPPEFSAINTNIQFSADGNTYVGDLALEKMQEAIGGLDLVLAVADYRQVLPPIVLFGGLAAFGLGLTILLTAIVLSNVGRRSRRALLQGFLAVRRLLPGALVALVVVIALSTVSVVLFEVAPLLRLDNLGRGQAYVLAIGAGLGAIALVTAWQALARLRTISHLFETEPYVLIAQPIDRNAAPGLWQLVEDAARHLGAPVPDTIAVGVAEGLFVISSAVKLLPDNVVVEGNTLHVPLGHLVFMEPDEVMTVIGHELAHFAGEDTDYSQNFLPIYRSFSSSINAVAAAGRAQDGSLSFLASPALALGYFVADRFHYAVQHWSRVRELQADAKSATLTSADAAGRALLRHSAISGLINDIIQYLWATPGQAQNDVVQLLISAAAERGLDDPSGLLESSVAHPADSHPDNRKRLAAFQFAVSSERLATAAKLPRDPAGLFQYFADPYAISRTVTNGLTEASRQANQHHQETLQATARAVSDDAVELFENTTPIAILMFVIAIPMLAAAAWTALFGLPGFGSEAMILVIAFGVCGGIIFLFGLQALRRAKTPYLRLFPDRVEHINLDQPIYWGDLRDLSVVNQAGTMVTTFLLKRPALAPKRVGFGGRGRIILNAGAGAVTIRSVPPRHYRAAGYIDLITRYADAAAARSALAPTADQSA